MTHLVQPIAVAYFVEWIHGACFEIVLEAKRMADLVRTIYSISRPIRSSGRGSFWARLSRGLACTKYHARARFITLW